MEKMNQVISVRATGEEKELLLKGAKHQRQSISSFLVKCALDKAEEIITRGETNGSTG